MASPFQSVQTLLFLGIWDALVLANGATDYKPKHHMIGTANIDPSPSLLPNV